MRIRKLFPSFLLFPIAISLSLFAADTDKKPAAPKEAPKPSYELPQPQTETIDYTMYGRIRTEALAHSHVMEYASALMDGIGPRLTGSPNVKKANDWTMAQFTAMGCSNAHLEDWGEFGIGWEQLNTWVRMTAPDNAVFIAQAAPWSPSTKGAVTGAAIWLAPKDENDLAKYKGKLSGKVVFLGDMREVKPVDKPLFTRYDEADLKKLQDFPLNRPRPRSSGAPADGPARRISRKARPIPGRRRSRGRNRPQSRRFRQRRFWRHHL